jgi:hypothetical protein
MGKGVTISKNKKVKVKLSLSSIKYHATKMNLFNKTPHHKEILGSGGTALHIHNLSTRWRRG